MFNPLSCASSHWYSTHSEWFVPFRVHASQRHTGLSRTLIESCVSFIWNAALYDKSLVGDTFNSFCPLRFKISTCNVSFKSPNAVVTPLRKAASYEPNAVVTPLRKATSYEPRTQCLIGACTSVRVNHFLKSTLNEDEVLNNFDTLYRETIRDIFCIPLIGIFFFSFCFPSYFPVFDTLNAIRAIRAGGGEKDFVLNVFLRVFIYADDVQAQWDMLGFGFKPYANKP